MSRPGVIPLVEDNPDDVLVTLRGVRALERTGGQGPDLAARRLRRIGWATLMFICLGCRPHPAAGPVSESVDGPAARSDGRVDVATAGEDNIPDLIEITGTAERLMALPRVGGFVDLRPWPDAHWPRTLEDHRILRREGYPRGADSDP